MPKRKGSTWRDRLALIRRHGISALRNAVKRGEVTILRGFEISKLSEADQSRQLKVWLAPWIFRFAATSQFRSSLMLPSNLFRSLAFLALFHRACCSSRFQRCAISSVRLRLSSCFVGAAVAREFRFGLDEPLSRILTMRAKLNFTGVANPPLT